MLWCVSAVLARSRRIAQGVSVVVHVGCVILQDEDYFHKIPEPTEDELDMLDLAFGLTET